MNSKIIVSVLLIICAFLSDCKKDTGNDTVKNLYRLKKLILYDDHAETSRLVFSYSHEKISGSEGYDHGILDMKAEYKYSGNTITLISKTLNDSGNWVNDQKEEYTLAGNLISQRISSEIIDGNWSPWLKGDYKYAGTKLTQYLEEDYSQGETYYSKYAISYNGSKINEEDVFTKDSATDWIQTEKETFTWSGDTLIGWMSYVQSNGAWIEDSKCNYIYARNILSQKVVYFKYADQWIPDETTNYSYNDNGYLSAEKGGNANTFYEYEVGNGNLAQFFYEPEVLIYKYPRIKRSSTNRISVLNFQQNISRIIKQ